MFKRISFALIAISILSACGSPKNQTAPGLTPSKTGLTTFRLAFYNLENLFDTIDGPNDDSEYLPDNWEEIQAQILEEGRNYTEEDERRYIH
jgi:hypothetical protein